MQDNQICQTDQKEENRQIKQKLLEYWVKLQKSLDEDYEEILQLGSESDPNDIINALFIIEDARQEQQKVYFYLIGLVRQITIRGVDKGIVIRKSETQSNNKADFQLEKRQLEIKINELSLALVQCKEDKILYMEQAQKEIQYLKEQELELKSRIQMLQYEQTKKSSFLENEDDSKRLSKDFADEDIPRQSTSPQIQKVKLDYSKLSQGSNLKKLTKVDQVQGVSQASFKFGNK
ncbi:unnamed protein product (macronuclear) [Paramecium tetraurelia]|uniref:Uncharacterized protein n=1 Tax=Paramecium tetraurelia TaxID=5888 RepID=A0DDC5_PARTE|nr:uncharacterized protein GSPATT00015901001 [Paramecium tetraurelia]CAK81042.1 unnamed protein product [Paramecium tetraurelia]|eukprot:XP_001448439.1 hypothetical protein (macronuclear) [Paramecium tetraurelia strain d4-2]